MIDELPEDQAVGSQPPANPAHEANGMAFLLASAAYLTLAGAHLRREGRDGLVLMDEIEAQITDALDSFAADNSADEARPQIILHAMLKVRALLDAGRTMAPDTRSLQ